MEKGREVEIYLVDMVLQFKGITSVYESRETGRLSVWEKNPEPKPTRGFFKKMDYQSEIERAAFASKKWVGWAWVEAL
jgi:hypothetical protein